MADFDPKNIEDYYRILTPQDLQGNIVFVSATTRQKASPADMVYESYINSAVSGKNIIEKIKGQEALVGKGWLYNTVYQEAKNPTSEFLEESYWAPSPQVKNSSTPAAKISNFYKEVCGVEGDDGPTKSFSINVLRSSALSAARAKTSEVEFFLNYMPPVFASRLVPYFDVEFQIPGQSFQGTDLRVRDVNRPSLYRFLMGSSTESTKKNQDPEHNSIPLSDADLALMSPYVTYKKDRTPEESYFVGMEMFTTPQTLTNMDSLSANDKGTSGLRLVDVKPFLPPASIVNATIQILNAGAGKFLHKKVALELKIHDKARLAEFSEFFRGPSGYRGITVWLTYGWLAPRGGQDDAYAKFINENMLVRDAFSVKNSSFSFDAAGQVTVKVELVSKGFVTIENSVISLSKKGAGSQRSAIDHLEDLLNTIKKRRSAFGEAPEGMPDLRIYQVLDAAAAGNIEFEIKDDELKSLISSAKDSVNASRNISNKADAIQLLNNVAELFGSQNGESNQKKRIKDEINEHMKQRFAVLDSASSPDPFLPSAAKVVNNEQLFSADLIAAMSDVCYSPEKKDDTKWDLIRVPKIGKDGKQEVKDGKKQYTQTKKFRKPVEPPTPKRQVSFGKIFCTFCLPTLLSAAEKEGIDEVQVNFYQFNDSCGPLSFHNIAEFPVDLDEFKVQFSEYAVRRGGDAMTVQEFIQFMAENQLSDRRSPGFGMRSYYEPYSVDKPAETAGGDESEFNSKMAKWFAKYGTLKQPNIAIKMETVAMGTGGSEKVDLLQKLSSTVASAYNDPTFQQTNGEKVKKIKKIHVYDKQHNPYSKKSQVLIGQNSSFMVYDGDSSDDLKDKFKSLNLGNDASVFEQFVRSKQTNVKTVKPSVNVIRDYIGNTVPTLLIGANGTLISNANLASKADGLIGTNNMLGGSYKASSTIAPNGLVSAQNNLPLRMVPAQLQMTSLGCPIADVYQAYFIDFGTATTLDSLYTCTQLNHSFSPGKFETSWTFAYTDGYGKFFGASNVAEILEKVAEKNNEGSSATSASPQPRQASSPA